MKECTVEGCPKPLRKSGSLFYCEMHYHRVRRTGQTAQLRPWRRNDGPCSIKDCDEPQDRIGLCMMHYTRSYRHGDPLVVIRNEDRNLAHGPANSSWTGDDASYVAIHQRLKRAFGPAVSYECSKCGAPARHWAYDHADPDERQADQGAYSVNPEHYSPLCVPCHKAHDLAVIAARREAPACNPCNEAVSSNPAEAEKRGFLLKSGRPSKAVPR